ncbi:MAG: class I SAM-dependent methyltransferase [Acidimicrobiia bacterium]|nr:class I SAM-dependent methyltransferase [Acidimicrobiia bacterium]
MSFSVAADAYDRFMGRFSSLLAPQFVDYSAVESGQVVLDVGCGPGSLTEELTRRLGASSVHAVDPSPSFVAAARTRNPGVDVHTAVAEDLPFPDGRFDATLAQLVVHFMSDPERGIREMSRVTHTGGVVAACVWDHAGGEGPLALFWDVVRSLHGQVHDESDLPGTRQGHLNEILESAGLSQVRGSSLVVGVEYNSFEEWWEPFNHGVGPAGAFVAGLASDERDDLREQCRLALPEAPFVISGRAWVARGQA